MRFRERLEKKEVMIEVFIQEKFLIIENKFLKRRFLRC